MNRVRFAAVAGQFYPADSSQLRRMIDGFLEKAVSGPSPIVPEAIIGPHAGYPFSGPIAASAYAHVLAGRDKIRRVVLLGPAHYVPVHGLAASSADDFVTPFGQVPLDQGATEALLSLSQVNVNDEAHIPEHGLEVHLPFLQVVLNQFSLVPLVVGDASAADVAQVLTPFADDPSALIVISSDLSHYQRYETAGRLDRETSDRIERLQPLTAGQACGRIPINGLLHLARERGWRAQTIDLRNSGDTAGSRAQVVGYGAFVFS